MLIKQFVYLTVERFISQKMLNCNPKSKENKVWIVFSSYVSLLNDICFCFRRSGILPKGASDYLKRRFGKKLHMPISGKKLDGSQENVNRIITFGSMPSYR